LNDKNGAAEPNSSLWCFRIRATGGYVRFRFSRDLGERSEPAVYAVLGDVVVS